MPKQVIVTDLELSEFKSEQTAIFQMPDLIAKDIAPYLYLKAKITDHYGRKVEMDIRLKFDEEGLVVDVYDNIARDAGPETSTYLFYNDIYTQEELDAEIENGIQS